MSILNQLSIQKLIHRIQQLESNSKAKWGMMTVDEMLVHCTAGIQMGLGEISSKIRTTPLRGRITKILFLYLLPFPKSTPAPPEINITKKLKIRSDFETARALLITEIKKLATIPDNYLFPPHPIFHTLSKREWAKVTIKHLNHHLKQFGV